MKQTFYAIALLALAGPTLADDLDDAAALCRTQGMTRQQFETMRMTDPNVSQWKPGAEGCAGIIDKWGKRELAKTGGTLDAAAQAKIKALNK